MKIICFSYAYCQRVRTGISLLEGLGLIVKREGRWLGMLSFDVEVMGRMEN